MDGFVVGDIVGFFVGLFFCKISVSSRESFADEKLDPEGSTLVNVDGSIILPLMVVCSVCFDPNMK